MNKLTLISIWFRGERTSHFVNARMENGKAIVSQETIDRILDKLGVRRGDTYSLGA